MRRNISLQAATLAGDRNIRMMRKIEYYSRFAAQLNFLRWTARGSNQHIVSNCLEESNKSGLRYTNIRTRRRELASLSSGLQDEQQTQHDVGDTIKKFVNTFDDKYDYSENEYLYRHIHKRLDHFAKLHNELHNLPVQSNILELEKLIELRKLDPYLSGRGILESIKIQLRDMNQQELAILLTAIKNKDEKEYRSIKKYIDLELKWLLKEYVGTYLMDIDLYLYLADIFYECLYKSTFTEVLVSFLAKESQIELSNAQFLHLLFLVVLHRNHQGVLPKYENRILKILDTASFEDIAIISLAYFKTKTKIENTEIRNKIIDRTIDHLDTIDPAQPGYCSIVKSLRYSRSLDSRGNLLNLKSELLKDKNRKIVSTSTYNAVHTIKMLEAYHIYEPELLDQLSTIMFKRLDEYRIKDIQYALSSLSNLCYNNLIMNNDLKKKFDLLCDKIIREDSSNLLSYQYFHLMPLLRAFSIFGYYNNSLIEYVNELLRDNRKVCKMLDALEFDKSALLVHAATRIEGDKHLYHPYFFKSLSDNLIRKGNQGSVKPSTTIDHLNFLLANVSETHLAHSYSYNLFARRLASSEELRDGPYNFNFQFTLPHQNYTDLVISKECKNPGDFDKDSLLPQPISPGQKHCILITIRKTDYVDNYKRISGFKRLMARLMKKLGYNVVMVYLYDEDIKTVALKVKSCLE